MGSDSQMEVNVGCELCMTAALQGARPPLERIATVKDGPLFLYRCANCGSYWEENLREIHLVSEEVARKRLEEAVR